MGSPITLKSWFASVEPGAPPGDRSLAVWIFGLRGEEGEPVALQLRERLGKDSFRTEVDGERRIVKLEGPLARNRAKTAGVDEMYLNTFREGITEHLEFTLHAARSLPPHKVRLSVAFPRSIRSSPSKKHSSPTKPPVVADEPLPDSLFDLGTGYQSPARARKTRKQLAEELQAARRSRDPFARLRNDVSRADTASAQQDRDADYASEEEETEAEAEEVEAVGGEEEAQAAVPAKPELIEALASSRVPSEATDARPEPAALPVRFPSPAPPDATAITSASTSPDEASAASPALSEPPAQTPPPPPRPSSKKERLASLTASFFRSRPTSLPATVAPANVAETGPPTSTSPGTIAAVLSTFFQKQPPSSPPPAPKSTAAKSPARTPVKRVLALADSLASSSPALVSRLEKAAGETLGGADERQQAIGAQGAEQAAIGAVTGVAHASVAEPAANEAAPADAVQNSEPAVVETQAPLQSAETRVETTAAEVQDERVAEPMDVDKDPAAAPAPPARKAATPPPSSGPLRQPTASPFARSTSRTASPRHSRPFASPRAPGGAPSERYSSIEPAFPSSQGGISSLFHDSADEGDGEDESADLTAQQISEFVERDLASSAIDEDEYKRERMPQLTKAARPPKELPATRVAQGGKSSAEPSTVDVEQQEEQAPVAALNPSGETVPIAAPQLNATTASSENPSVAAIVDPSPATVEPEPVLEASATRSTSPPPATTVDAVAVTSAQNDDRAASPAQDCKPPPSTVEAPTEENGDDGLAVAPDLAKYSIEEAAQGATEEAVSAAVGNVVESVAGPVISDAVAEIAAQAAGEVVTGLVGTFVDSVVDAVAETAHTSGEEPASAQSGSQNLQAQQEPSAAVEPEAPAFVEQDFVEPEQSKDQDDGDADFAAEYWAQPQSGDLAAFDSEVKDESLPDKEPRKKLAINGSSPRSPRSPSGSILSRKAAATASDPIALAALSALRNEQAPGEGPVNASANERRPAGPSRESSHDVFGPVDLVQKPPSPSTPSQSRPPRARTLSARQHAAPVNEPQSRQPGKKPHRRGSTFIGVEILVSPRKRPARARNSTAPPVASTSRAGPAKEPERAPEANIFDSPAAASTPPPVPGKSWLDASAKTGRRQSVAGQRIDDEDDDDLDDESDDPLAEPIKGKKREGASELPVKRHSKARACAADEQSDESGEDEAVARTLLNGTGVNGRQRAAHETDADTEQEQDHGEEGEKSRREEDGEEPAPPRKKRSRDATPPSKAKRRRVSLTSAPSGSQAASSSQQAPRRPSLAGKISQSAASQPARTARETPARTDSTSGAPRGSITSAHGSTPGSSNRPARTRKPVDGWWDISRGIEAAAPSAKKRKREETSAVAGEGTETVEPKRGRKRRAVESSPELGVEAETHERPDRREASMAREDDDFDNSRDDDFDPTADAEVDEDDEDDESLASPKPVKKAPVPKATPVNGANGTTKKKRRKRKSIVMPTFRNRKRQSAVAAASASASPAPSQTPDPRPSLAGKGKAVVRQDSEQSLARASSVRKARKEVARREDVRDSSSERPEPTQPKTRPSQAKKAKQRKVELPEWAEGDEWAGLREVGIAREADEDPFHFSD